MKTRHWEESTHGDLIYLMLVEVVPEMDIVPGFIWEGERTTIIRIHPIPFTAPGEAARAVARLNAREAGETGEPVPTPPEDEVRATRQSRIAELRAKRLERESA